MAASVSVKQFTGPSATPTTITSLVLCLADAANDGTAHPVTAPGSGSVQSFSATLAPNADSAPAGGINNVKFYSSGTNPWTGVTLQVAKGGTYTQATGSGSTGTVLNTTNFPGTTAPVDAFSYTSGSPLSLAGSLAGGSTGRITSDYLMLQETVSSVAIQGALAPSTMYFQYDET